MNDDDDELGPELSEFRANARSLDKAKRVVRTLLKDAAQLRRDVLSHVPFRPDNGLPLNWLCGYGPDGGLVLTVQLKTRNVELVELPNA